MNHGKMPSSSNDSTKFRQLENLFQTVKSHSNALKALAANPASYESLALLGIKECLPFDLRVKYFLDIDSANEMDLGSMLKFLEKEIQARRNSWIAEPGRSVRKDTEKKSWDKKITKPSESREPRNQQYTGARPKQRQEKRQSSMFQETDQAEESKESLN